MPRRPKRGAKPTEARIRRLVEHLQEEMDHQANAAQILAFDAMQVAEPAERLERAVDALEVSPLAVDGWAMLAAAAPAGSPLALMLWRQAVAVGVVVLSPWRMAEMKGEFWAWTEARPYMSARAGLAQELRRQGHKSEAVAELKGMLTLNPNDNQGVRYMLLDWLLADGSATAAAALHKRYVDDASAMWQYAAALLAFRRKGDGAEARTALAEAIAGNPHVPALLLGRTNLPAVMPDYYSPGDESEAVVCVESAAPAWKATPGALDWLASQVPGDAPTPRRLRAKG